MYQSFVYIEVRIQLPAVGEIFTTDKNSGKIAIHPDALKKTVMLSKALGCRIPPLADIERFVGSRKVSTDEENDSCCSIKMAEDGFMKLSFHSRKKSIKIEQIRIEKPNHGSFPIISVSASSP